MLWGSGKGYRAFHGPLLLPHPHPHTVLPTSAWENRRHMTDAHRDIQRMVTVSMPLPPTALTNGKSSSALKSFRAGKAPASSKSNEEERSVRRWEGQHPGRGRENQIGLPWWGAVGRQGLMELGHHWL